MASGHRRLAHVGVRSLVEWKDRRPPIPHQIALIALNLLTRAAINREIARTLAPMTEPPTDQTNDQRFAPIPLWRVASRLMVTLFNLFGESQVLASKYTLTARDYKLACDWLRTLEALFRKLLFIEASYYAHEASQTKPRTKYNRARRWMTFTDDNPDAWRVSFRFWDRGPPDRQHSTTHRQARTPYPIRFNSAWPLAERFEALLRVHNNPAPFAKRLARRLYANPPRITDLQRAPDSLAHRIDAEPYAEINALIASRHAIAFPDTT